MSAQHTSLVELLIGRITRLADGTTPPTPVIGGPGSNWSARSDGGDGQPVAIYGGPLLNGRRSEEIFEFKDIADCEECIRPSYADLHHMAAWHPGVARAVVGLLSAVSTSSDPAVQAAVTALGHEFGVRLTETTDQAEEAKP